MYKNSLVIIRTKKDNIVECHMIFTKQYQRDNPSQFVYDGYQCSEFEIAETVGGKVIVTTKDHMNTSKIPVEHRLEFDNVTQVELLTTHTIKCGASAIDPLSKCDQTVVFDFDGVIHSYKSGWKGSTVISDPPVEGIEEVLRELKQCGYNIVVSSSRCDNHDSLEAVNDWMLKYDLLKYVDLITNKKPPALCYVDDRAICFRGDTKNLVERIKHFEPWHGEILNSDDDTFNYFKPEKGIPPIKCFADIRKNGDYIPQSFEIWSDVNTNKIYIGDGKTPLSELMGYPLNTPKRCPVVPVSVGDKVYIITEPFKIVTDNITKIWSQNDQWIASTERSEYTYNLTQDFNRVIFNDYILAYIVYQHNRLEGSENK